jgi:hypothetical protein
MLDVGCEKDLLTCDTVFGLFGWVLLLGGEKGYRGLLFYVEFSFGFARSGKWRLEVY